MTRASFNNCRGLIWPVHVAGVLHAPLSDAALRDAHQQACAAGHAGRAAGYKAAARAMTVFGRGIDGVLGNGLAPPGWAAPDDFRRAVHSQRVASRWTFGWVGSAGLALTDGCAAGLSAAAGAIVGAGGGNSASARRRTTAAVEGVGYRMTGALCQLSALVGVFPKALIAGIAFLAGVIGYGLARAVGVSGGVSDATSPAFAKQWVAPAEVQPLCAALSQQFRALAPSLDHADLTDPRVCRQFGTDASRQTMMMPNRDGVFEDLRAKLMPPAEPPVVFAAICQRLDELCESDPKWMWHVSQVANQTLGNLCIEMGVMGSQGLDGHEIDGQRVESCAAVLSGDLAPKVRMSLARVDEDTIELRWQNRRHIKALVFADDTCRAYVPQRSYCETRLVVDIGRPSSSEPPRVTFKDVQFVSELVAA